MKRLFFVLILMLSFGLSGCAEIELASHLSKEAFPPPPKSQGTFKVGTPYKVEGQRYYPKESYDLTETGIASWYGSDFHGRKTANGEFFDKNELTAAHRTLQMPSLVRVTNLENGRSLIVRVNDRGPYKRGRVIDVSERASELLGFKQNGTAKVRLEVLKQESLRIAEAAKNGQNTSGYELALNRGGALPAQAPVRVAMTAQSPADGASYGGTSAAPLPAPVSSEILAMDHAGAVPGHTRNGAFYPDPVVTELPTARADIFVQAGSFTVAENAYRLSAQLRQIGGSEVYPVLINGRQFYRVRLGPIGNVAEADSLLARVVSAGNDNAIIVVE